MNNQLNENQKQYLENIIRFHLQIKKFKELMKSPIKIENPLDCYLINNDIIAEYLNNELSKKISEEINNSFFSDINHIINKYENYNNNIKIEKLYPAFLLPENLKINDIEYPYNFFILQKEYFAQMINITESTINDFKLYNLLIGKDGIFIWIKEKDKNRNEEKYENNNKEEDKNKIIVFYLDDIKLNEFKIDKIFIFKNYGDFEKEVKICNKIGRYEYFKLRNIKNDKIGYYNIIDDGKIIGQYINVKRNYNFITKKSSVSENSDNNSNANYNNNNNINANNENSKISNKIDKKFENDNTKDYIIKIFLPHIMTCLSKIECLKIYLTQRLRKNDSNLNKKRYDLIHILALFISKYNSVNSDIKQEITNFIDAFFNKDLNNNIQLNNENRYIFFKNIIEVLINELNNELNIDSNNEGNVDIKKNNSFIFHLFYGKKTENNIVEYFNTFFINTDDYAGNQEKMELEEIINSFKFKENINHFPRVMILIINYKYKDFLIVKSKLKITRNNKNYNLVSCIQYSGEFSSIFKYKDSFGKIYWDDEINCDFESVINKEEELNNCFVYFYEEEFQENNNNMIYYNNNSLNNTSNHNLNFINNNTYNYNNLNCFNSNYNCINQNSVNYNLNNNNYNNYNLNLNYFNNNNNILNNSNLLNMNTRNNNNINNQNLNNFHLMNSNTYNNNNYNRNNSNNYNNLYQINFNSFNNNINNLNNNNNYNNLNINYNFNNNKMIK